MEFLLILSFIKNIIHNPMEYIGIITTDIPKDLSIGEGYIVINTENDEPVLQYSTIKRNIDNQEYIDWVTIDGTDSSKRATQISDLEYQLRIRDWNITERLFVNNSNLYLYRQDPSETLDPIPQIIPNDSKGIKISETITEESEEEFNEYYEKLMNLRPIMNINGTQVDFGNAYYYNLISSRDLIQNTSVIDLISLGGSEYTNILNLNELLEKTPEDSGKYLDCDCILKLGIKYSLSGEVFTKNLMFEPFDLVDGVLKPKDFTKDISNNITLEYLDRCIRLFPKTSEVTECIISYCYIVYYGGLI